MSLPARLKIGHLDYTVEAWDSHESRDRERWGENNARLQIIRISCDSTPQKEAETLLHEIAHAIYVVWKLPDPATEETVASVMSSAFATVFRDNPPLLLYLAERLTECPNPEPKS